MSGSSALPSATPTASPSSSKPAPAPKPCVVKARDLTGKVVQKEFDASVSTISDLYLWLNSEHNKSKEEFVVQNSYPRDVWSGEQMGMTLAAAGLSPQGSVTMIRPNATQKSKVRDIGDHKTNFFDELFGSKKKKAPSSSSAPKKKKKEKGFFEKIFGSDSDDEEQEREKERRRRGGQNGQTIADLPGSGRTKGVEKKKIDGMHSNVMGFK
eukprot:TRINITY_DN1070_c0_g1_i2.p2 TRINITY_DN1070_c0_g1~~TRINITY_DN1070_c0_g1_i2.p2  ORF type:complete len:234 (+),score=60.63 TRINITY_DN1070_c0_g1_i2:71-703(+)